MNKRIISLLLACLLFTGCKSVSIKEVAKNLQNAKNYNAEVTLEIDGKFNDELITYKREKQVKIDNMNSSAEVISNINLNNEIKKETYYLKSVKDTIITYREYEDYYSSQIDAKDKNSLYYITAFINENSTYQYIEKDDGIIHYVVTLNRDRIKDFISSYYDVSFLNGVEFNVLESAKINVYVNNKTKNIISLDVDFTKVINFIDVEPYELDRFYLEIKYTDFNKVEDIIISSDIIDSAIDINVIEAYNDAVLYVKEVNNLLLNDKTTTYTNNNLNYEGPKPDSVVFTILNGKVISGELSINNYNFKVESGIVSSPKDIEEVE